MALEPEAKQAISLASRSGVERVLLKSKGAIRENQWLPRPSSFSHHPPVALNPFNWTGPKDVDLPKLTREQEIELARYVVAGALQHPMDGWRYLGRAMSAFSSGDLGAAQHLAYYAELRACLGLLAVEGIGVLDKPHAAVNEFGHATLFQAKRTHQFSWPALAELSTKPGVGSRLMSRISSGGQTLDSWLHALGVSSSDNLMAQWVFAWGKDLKLAENDRAVRNRVSYGPTVLSDTPPPKFPKVSRLMTNLVNLLAPGPGGSFPILDQYLVRAAIENAYEARYAKPAKQYNPDFVTKVEQVVATVQPIGLAPQEWCDFLLRRGNRKGHLVFLLAARDHGSDEMNSAASIICRAALLLRLSSASVAALAHDAGISNDTVSAWWRGIVLAGLHDEWPPTTLSDIWESVEQASLAMATWTADNARQVPGPSYATFLAENAGRLSSIAKLDCLAMAGMGLSGQFREF